MHKFHLEQKLEIFGLPANLPLNGEIVIVKHLPGWYEDNPSAYGVQRKDGTIVEATPKYLRPFPPELDRGNMDVVSTWEAFEKATGIFRDVLRYGPSTGTPA